LTELIRSVLENLRRAADEAQIPWPDLTWISRDGERVVLSKREFIGLPLPSGQTLELRARLVVPERLLNVSLPGEALHVSVDSIYPIELDLDGRTTFPDVHRNVAPGPIIGIAAAQLHAGDNGELHLQIHIPQEQTWLNWVYLTFTTPSLRRRFELLDLAWSRLALADAVATTREERSSVLEAIKQVPDDVAQITIPELERLERVLAQALVSLNDAVGKLQVHVVGHSHIDLNWLWTWDDTAAVIKRDFASILGLMDEFPEMTFTHSQAATYDLIQRESPELFERLKRLVAEGRWEVAAMQWVESDLNMPSGEALAEQLLHGVGYARRELGVSPRVFLAPDAFGHSGNLPQLAASAGAICYYHERRNPGGLDPWPAYWWYGDDGTRLLCCSTPTYWGSVTAGGIAQAAIRAHKHNLRSGLFFQGVGHHGGGPTREGLMLLRQLSATVGFVKATCSTLGQFAADVSEQPLLEHRGELNSIFEGCYTTNARAKARNREAENLLTTAGTFAAMAGLDERDAMAEAWQPVLLNQFHDILCGSSIREVYEESAKQIAAALKVGAAVRDRALARITAGLPAGIVSVTNPLGWDREDVVVLPGVNDSASVTLKSSDGIATPGQPTPEGIVFIARVPAFGTATYSVEVGDTPATIPQVTESLLSIDIATHWCRLRLHRESGAFMSFVLQEDGRELVAFGERRATDYLDSARFDLAINVLQIVQEAPHGMSAWHLDSVTTERSLINGGSAEIVEIGPVGVVVRLKHNFGSSSIWRDVFVYSSISRIDVTCEIDWRELGSPETGVTNLKVASTVPLLEPQAWFETPFGVCRRPVGGQEVAALRWADVGDEGLGLAILNDGRYGHDALGPRLRMTLVRGAYEPDPEADIGIHRVKYSLVPHSSDWRDAGIPRMAAGFNQPLVANMNSSLLSGIGIWRPSVVGGAGILLSSLKVSEDGQGYVARFHETHGRSSSIVLRDLPDVSPRVWESTLTEDLGAEIPVGSDGTVQLEFRPWQVRTLVVKPLSHSESGRTSKRLPDNSEAERR
jgi:alpha-mannosidase